MAIGSSSNYAQIALSYSYTIDDPEIDNLVCILSVVAQIAIDNAKRSYSIDLVNEIDHIKQRLCIESRKYPCFWEEVERLQEKKTKKHKEHSFDPSPKDTEADRERKAIEKKEYFREDLECPMNTLYLYKFKRHRSSSPTLPDDYFFRKYELKENRRTCRKIEEIIQKYSWELYQYNATKDDEDGKYFLLQDDFNSMIKEIKKIHISNNYLGLMSYLIDRALHITNAVKNNKGTTKSKLYKNQSLLMKTLYDISPEQFLQCFSRNCAYQCEDDNV